jgi:hypothetical protein
LEDRTITHYPNPAPGNKPICVGHQYSLLSLLPSEILTNQKHWLVPLLAKRVKSSQKGNEAGMKQIRQCIDELGLKDALSISIGDSLYGTEKCRSEVSEQQNLIHLFRLNAKRNVFRMPTEASAPVGRKKEFGEKMQLGETVSLPCDREVEIVRLSKKGKVLTVKIKCWDNMLLRGSRQFKSSKFPLNVLQVSVINENGERLFKRPMWLGVLGERRHELSLPDAYDHYRLRYDTEHLFRFNKNKLLMDEYQTPDVSHEESWWQLCLLAYVQLYLAKGLTPCMPQPWERYLPEFKNPKPNQITSPSQTQRGFAKILENIGTPATPCVARGKPSGRMEGALQVKRSTNPIIFKTQKAQAQEIDTVISEFEKQYQNSNPEKIEALIKLVQTKLGKFNLSPSAFAEMLINTS